MSTEKRKQQVKQAVQKWREVTKQRMVDAMGGKCQICGYCKSNRALEFHHIDPNEKEFGFSRARAKGWQTLVSELRKCILLCGNCHQEVHDGITELPVVYAKFNEAYVDYKIQC